MSVHSERFWVCLGICVAILLSSFGILPPNIKAELATVVSEPYVFVPNGEGAELLIDSQDSLYWLHVISGDIYFRRYNSSHMLQIPDKPVYLSGANENVDAVWDDFGSIHFTWATDYFGAQSVMYAKIDVNGDFIVPPIKLSGNNTARDFASAIDVNSLGQAYVAWDYWWDLSDPIGEDVLYAKIDSDGSIIFTQQYVAPQNWSTDFFAKKDIVVDRDDNLHIIFDRQYSNFDIYVYYKKFASDGTTVLVSEKQLISTVYKNSASSMEAVLDSQSRINIAYSYGLSGGMIEAFYTRIDLQGNVEIGPIRLSLQDSYHSHQAYLAMDDYDNSYVFWRETKDGNGEIYYAVVHSNGTVVLDLTRLTDTSRSEAIYYMGAVFDSTNVCIWSYYDDNGTYVVYTMPPPETTIIPGLPRYRSSPIFVTSATPFSFVISDPSGSGIRGTYYHVDSSEWENYTLGGPFSVFGEGAHSIFYNSTGMAGNIEPTKVLGIVVDDTSPTSSVITGGPNYTSGQIWVTPLTPISINAVDGGIIPVGLNYSRYRVRNGGSWTSWENYSTAFTIGPIEGVSYVEFYSSDFLWNNENTSNATYIVDNTPPETKLLIGEPNYTAGNTWVSSSTPLSLNATDGGQIPVGVSRIMHRIWQVGSWDNWRDYTVPFTLGSEGTAYVEYYSIDHLNNTEVVHNETFIVDNTSPSTVLQIGTANYTSFDIWINFTTPLALEASDGGSPPLGVIETYYRMWKAGAWDPWVKYGTNFSFSGYEGRVYLEFYSEDALGNQEVVLNRSLIVDNTPPTTSMQIGRPNYTYVNFWISSSTSIELASTDGGDIPVGVNNTYYRIWAGSWSSWQVYSTPFDLETEGLNYVEYYSLDLVGNQELVQNETLIVDNTPPTTSVEIGGPRYRGNEDAYWNVTSSSRFYLNSTDGGSIPCGVRAIEVYIDDVLMGNYTDPFTLEGYEDGIHKIDFRAMDNLMNTEDRFQDHNLIFINLDNTPPISTIYPNETDIGLNEVFLLEADDGYGSGVHEILFSIDDGEWQTYTGEFSLDEYGHHTIAYGSVDNLGNTEQPKELVFEIAKPSENWKPLVALIFTIILLICGLIVSKRRPIEFKTGISFSKTFLLISFPFWLTEVITGILSFFTGWLSIPPFLGIGTFLDLAILFGGLIALAIHGKREEEESEREVVTEDSP